MAEDLELMNKYGKPLIYDGSFHGPKWRNRSCTDVPCLLIFLVFLAGWAFIAQYAIRNGDLNKLMVPTDSFNRKCGIDSSVLNKKYLFFFNLERCIDPLVPLTGCPTPQVCVERCPTQTFVWDTMKDSLSFEELKSRMICLTDMDRDSIRSREDARRAIEEKRCARFYIKGAPFLNRCMWEFSPRLCEYIPRSLLARSQRSMGSEYNSTALLTVPESTEFSDGDSSNRGVFEAQMQAMALTASMAEQRVETKLQSQDLSEEPAVLCRRRTELGETVIKEKMMQTDTRLAKFVGNMVAHFYNGTHDAQQLGEEIVEDIVNSAFVVLMALVCTLVASLLLIALMRWLASPILWLSILGVLVGLVVAVYYCFREYRYRSATAAATVENHAPNVEAVVMNIVQKPSTWLWLTIALCVCFLVILLLVIVLRTRISIAIALTKEGSKAVSSVISTVFFPIFSWVLYILAIVYAIGVGLYLGSIGEPAFRMTRQLDRNSATGLSVEQCQCTGPAAGYSLGNACEPLVFQQNCHIERSQAACISTSCSFSEIKHSPFVTWSIVYNVFGFLWLSFFISAFSDMVLAATFATWYWTFKKKDVPYFTLTRSLRQTAFYHLGTLAFGSLILAVCRLIRLVLEYIDAKLKKYDNTVTRAILCCMKCFFWLLESFLRFLNRNAYIMCAIHGKNFCASAKDAFNLLMRNFLRVVAVDQVTDFLFFLSKVLLTGAAAVGTYYFLKGSPTLLQLHYNAVPTTIVAVGAFLISSVFFGVYSMAVDTLFLCFLEDCERNDGTPEKPYYMSKQLMRILGKRNKFMQKRTQRPPEESRARNG